MAWCFNKAQGHCHIFSANARWYEQRVCRPWGHC